MNVEFHDTGKDSADLVHVHRGELIESVHRGTVVVVEDGEVVFAAGDPGLVTYYRSTAKLFQSMALVTTGAADRFGLDDKALAIAAGSHNATEEHIAVVREMLERAGVPEDALGCGGHWSIDKRRGREQVAEVGPHVKPLPAIWSNCSGKHAGMLAIAKATDLELETYLHPEHAVQKEITRIVATLAGRHPSDVELGVDGCGAPVHGISVQEMAYSLAAFGAPDQIEDATLRQAARRVGNAVSAHPEMVAGGKRFDTDLMTSASTRILSKSGAEGVQGVAVPERKMGLAIKVDDGHDRGYRLPVIELLRRFGVLSQDEADGLAERHGRTVKNWAGAEVGHLEVVL